MTAYFSEKLIGLALDLFFMNTIRTLLTAWMTLFLYTYTSSHSFADNSFIPLPADSVIQTTIPQLPPHLTENGFDSDPNTLFHSNLGVSAGRITVVFPNPVQVNALRFTAQRDSLGMPFLQRLPTHVFLASTNANGPCTSDALGIYTAHVDRLRGEATYSFKAPPAPSRTVEIFLFGNADCLTFSECVFQLDYVHPANTGNEPPGTNTSVFLFLLLCALTVATLYAIRVASRDGSMTTAHLLFAVCANRILRTPFPPSIHISHIAGQRTMLALRPFFIATFITALMLSILSPFLTNGFWFDDALNSQLYYRLERFDLTLWEFTWRVYRHWLTQEGRMMACFFTGYPLWYVAPRLIVAKLLNMGLAIAGFALFARSMQLLGFTGRGIGLWLLLLAGSFQIHGAGLDPLAGFLFHYPVLALQLSICCLLLACWNNSSKGLFLYSALGFWLICMTCYEINIVFVPIAVICAISRPHRTQSLTIIFLTTLAYFACYALVRTHALGDGYIGARVHISPRSLQAYFQQLSASIPFSAYIASTHDLLPFNALVRKTLHSGMAWVVYLSSLAAFRLLLEKHAWPPARIWAVSACMLFVPPVLVAISTRYSQEVAFGVGTLPVYYQFFGMAFFIAMALMYLSRWPYLRNIAAVLMAALLALNVTMNFQMVRLIDEAYRKPRDIFAENAMQGLFEQLVDGDTVFIASAPHYVNGDLIFQYAHKRVFVPSESYEFVTTPNILTGREFDLENAGSTFLLKPRTSR